MFIYVVFGTVAIHLWTKSLPTGMFHELPISAYATPRGWLVGTIWGGLVLVEI